MWCLRTHVHKSRGTAGQLHQGPGVIMHGSHLASLNHLSNLLTGENIKRTAPWWQEMAAQGEADQQSGWLYVQNPCQDLKDEYQK